MSSTFPFLRLPPELQVRVCELYFAKPFTIHVFPRSRSFSFVKGSRRSVQDDLTKWSDCQLGLLPHARSLLQASPELCEQARTALLKAFNGQVYCTVEWESRLSLPHTINRFLENFLTYPLPKDRVRDITLCVEKVFNPGPKLSTVVRRDWKEFVELVGHSRLLNLELIRIELDDCRLPGLIRGEHDVELFLQGGKDDKLVACIQKYLPKMEVGDAGKIERADGLLVPVVVSVSCYLPSHPKIELFAEVKLIDPQAITVMGRDVSATGGS
ncbi:hypothetical protein LTR70_002398 [Exophiala xenobiotica]|uniref:Uncharacterized protein n=1 Tax=Lithohypha guttulata TaxID=1690604 RepID=A0ABR0KKT2_9EURO|nr:hypothetical protein LTR24_001395 [Lithohypha guttulata]KAK5325426.1 hypothetical protein LTR70_002398 [Exophiala xenobiotica]